jgi:hypothetical protein
VGKEQDLKKVKCTVEECDEKTMRGWCFGDFNRCVYFPTGCRPCVSVISGKVISLERIRLAV